MGFIQDHRQFRGLLCSMCGPKVRAFQPTPMALNVPTCSSFCTMSET